ncbi:hypothetical protein AWL63_18220 [Sphingomonas panacis]|uniref:Uncharacterized protein n=1 Tax=Sphingomonas panacis TaxID=1560345 RepID=A0A1B3ZDU1_9SPHN|nr:hypothetical protein [Sphingomonas panacis]AOH85583.1 hypothetical protein AWL63_18220 [Sphingomonas panacis]
MGERSLFAKTASEQRWTEKAQVDLLLRYIENQDSAGAFEDFLAEQCADISSLIHDPADRFLWAVAEELEHAGLIHRSEFQSFCADSFETMTVGQAADFWRMHEGN